MAVCHDRRHRQRPRAGAALHRACRLPVAVRRRQRQPQDAGRLPGRPRRPAGAAAGRRLCGPAQGGGCAVAAGRAGRDAGAR